MAFNPDIHHRRSIRLKGYDYSGNGAYFVTVCSYKKEFIFSSIKNNEVHLSKVGEIIVSELNRSIKIREEIEIDSYIIMPNHIHMIVFIVGANGNLPGSEKDGRAKCLSPLQMQPGSLSSFVSGLKSSVTRRIGYSLWQRNYYEHIIRKEQELNTYRKYIRNNPAKWEEDEYFIR